jgi:hypothetical protein
VDALHERVAVAVVATFLLDDSPQPREVFERTPREFIGR